jgi:predicted aminopeptidase
VDVLKNILKFCATLAIASLLSGCLFTYLVKSGYNQLKLLSNREPIEDVIKKPDTTPKLKQKLELSLKVRDFAEKKLRLKSTDNYKTYVDIKRPFVTYIVTAAEKWQLEPKLYWYPIVGSLPYKGYFDKDDANEEAKTFDTTKYDTMVRGVSAYSTLGWFDDPILSTMIEGDDHYLVNLIIHESTHATLYFKSQADFNERLASFIGNIGTELYYLDIEGEKSKTLESLRQAEGDEKLFSEFISQTINNLRAWYKTEKGITEEMREAQFAAISKRFQTEVLPKMKSDRYKNFSTMKLNNAVLLYFNTYVYDLSDFEKLYNHFGRDLNKFMTFCKGLEKSEDPHLAVKTYLSSLPSSSSAN